MSTKDIWATTALAASGVRGDSAAGAAAAAREHVLQMTHDAERAVLNPADPGGWPPPLRAALACRCARLNGCDALADRYLQRIDSARYRPLADPADDGGALNLQPVIAFIDRVAVAPADVDADDVSALQRAGIGDADIVRLAELNAFLAYQIRLTTGLALLARHPR